MYSGSGTVKLAIAITITITITISKIRTSLRSIIKGGPNCLLSQLTTFIMSGTNSSLALVLGSLAYFTGNLHLVSNPRLAYPEVQTNHGRLRGVRSVARSGRVYSEFLGIPYAEPPIGDLRFEPPQPLQRSWSDVRDATNYGSSCLQYEYFSHVRAGHEDCLTLNVHTPAGVGPRPLMPVIVFLHGGFFMSGLPYLYRPKYFMEQDVVLVTLNYRVNSFGFLNTGDGTVRGNMGLKDQVMALRWIQANIHHFGGNPRSVTLMGHSAGAASATLHLLSSLSTGLFHRAIVQSGSALCPWGFTYGPRVTPVAQARRLGSFLNCPTRGRDTRQMVACMKRARATDVERFHREYLSPLPDLGTIFRPSAELGAQGEAFITESPLKMLREGQIVNRVPVIIGVNNHEGNFVTLYMKALGHKFDPAFQIRNLMGESNPERIQRITAYYFGNSTAGRARALEGHRITKIVSDLAFSLPIHDTIKYLSAAGLPVYPYFFTYGGEGGASTIQSLAARSVAPAAVGRVLSLGVGAGRKWLRERTGVGVGGSHGRVGAGSVVGHGDELVYLFNIPGIADEIVPGSPHYEFSHDLVKLWVSFAKNGRPSKFGGVHWPPVAQGTQASPVRFMELGARPAMVVEPFGESVAFWKTLEVNRKADSMPKSLSLFQARNRNHHV